MEIQSRRVDHGQQYPVVFGLANLHTRGFDFLGAFDGATKEVVNGSPLVRGGSG